jgi:hypothetical protein
METYIGVVTHYFNHLGVAVLSLTRELRINDIVHVVGHTTDFCQKTLSLEINHHQVEVGRPDEDVAMKVVGVVRSGDKVYLAPEGIPTRPEDIQQQWLDEWER